MSWRRTLVVATWLAGTLLATAIVYEAVNVVAGQVTEKRSEPISQAGRAQANSQPGQGTPPPAPAVATPSPSPTGPAATVAPGGNTGPAPTPAGTNPPRSSRTFALVGGTTSLSCSGAQIFLNWATPNSGYQVEIGTSNSGAQIEVRFRSDTHESRLESWCAGGQVQGSIREETS